MAQRGVSVSAKLKVKDIKACNSGNMPACTHTHTIGGCKDTHSKSFYKRGDIPRIGVKYKRPLPSRQGWGDYTEKHLNKSTETRTGCVFGQWQEGKFWGPFCLDFFLKSE